MPIQSKQQPPYYQTSEQILIYEALISEVGGNVITQIITNTIGDIVWTKPFDGTYVGTLTGAFPIDKTTYHIESNKGTALVTLMQFSISQNNQPDSLTFEVFDKDGNNIADNLFKAPITIKVKK